MRKITLVRIDGDEKLEVDIPVGETIIGRGPVMQCTDKRVSRTHAQIKVSEDGKIELTSTSQNPCFYNNEQVISKSTSVELNIGDQFSFLPDSYCYCVKTTEGSVSSAEMTSSSSCRKNDTSEDPVSTELTVNEGAICQEPNVHSFSIPPHSDSCNGKITVPLTDADIATDTSSGAVGVFTANGNQKNSVTDTSLDSVKKYVPRWLLAATKRAKSSEGDPSAEKSGIKKTEEADTITKVGSPKREISEDHTEVRQSAPPAVGAHQLSDDSETEEPTKVNQSNMQQSVDTEQTGVGTEEETQNTPASPGTSHSPSKVDRDSCRYGTACYRKNPQHRAEFSHPGDHDYTEDNRPECPYGTECYRKNPLHKQSYRHTQKPSKKPPKKRQRTKKTESGENSEEDDDYDYDDPFLNDGSSDDYEPTDSDSEVSGSEGEDEDDMKRTKKEGKRFIQGKRKH